MLRRFRALAVASTALMLAGACGEDRSPGKHDADARPAAAPQTHEQVVRAYRSDRRWARSHLLGLAQHRARVAANARGLDFRVVRRNGRDLFRTSDRVRTRVNVELRSGRVTRVVGLF
jgi:hypothetical protein